MAARDQTFETVDSYSVTKLDPGVNSHMRQTHTDIHETLDYQGGQWWVTGSRVQRGHTWYYLRNAHGDKNIMLDKTLHHIRTTHPFYMPDGPFYSFAGRTWFINDVFKSGGATYYDAVDVNDHMEHHIATKAFMDAHRAREEVHYVDMGPRRLVHQPLSPTEAEEDYDPREDDPDYDPAETTGHPAQGPAPWSRPRRTVGDAGPTRPSRSRPPC